MSVVTSGPDESNHFNEAWNHHSPNDRKNGETLLLKTYTVWKIRKFGEPQETLMYQKTED